MPPNLTNHIVPILLICLGLHLKVSGVRKSLLYVRKSHQVSRYRTLDTGLCLALILWPSLTTAFTMDLEFSRDAITWQRASLNIEGHACKKSNSFGLHCSHAYEPVS